MEKRKPYVKSTPKLKPELSKLINLRLPVSVYKQLVGYTRDRNFKFQDLLIDLMCVLSVKSPDDLRQFLTPIVYNKYFKPEIADSE